MSVLISLEAQLPLAAPLTVAVLELTAHIKRLNPLAKVVRITEHRDSWLIETFCMIQAVWC